MDNSEIADRLKFLGQLMELHNENPFKVKSYGAAAFRIDRMEKKLDELSREELEQVEGIGKGMAAKIHELFSKGTIADLDRLTEATPPGVLSMFAVKGIGPKKIAVIWKELGVETIGELLYACNENRLVELKGFGQKTQEQIRKSIEFLKSSEGKYHYAAVENVANEIVNAIRNHGIKNVSVTGALRRKCEIIKKIEIIAGVPNENIFVKTPFMVFPETLMQNISVLNGMITATTPSGITVEIITCAEDEFVKKLFESTGCESHVDHVVKTPFMASPQNPKFPQDPKSEQEIYTSAGLPYIEPELREGLFEFELAKKNKMPDLIRVADLKGILHNHTTYSDGKHTLEEMALYCKELGYEYLGICDHSKSAQYAGGLHPEKVMKQQNEIDELNQRLSPFRIFKGIESDILNDGSLDYEDSVLKSFDFIVASVHSNLRMDEEKAMKRLIKAIENPYTTILGHPTGRLLLARPGYPLDHKKIIDACAANRIIIELNAHPYRLDIDWRWIPYAMEKGVKISINPDAHHKEGYHDMYFGVCTARKGALTKEMTFNTMTIAEMEKYLRAKKQLPAP